MTSIFRDIPGNRLTSSNLIRKTNRDASSKIANKGFFLLLKDVISFGILKSWNGSFWVSGRTIRIWDGSSWVIERSKLYNNTEWITTSQG